jgi:hypothetical protein
VTKNRCYTLSSSFSFFLSKERKKKNRRIEGGREKKRKIE